MSVWQSLVPIIPIVITIYVMLLLPSHYIHLVAGGGRCGHIGPGVFATDNSIMARREPPRAPRRDKTGANSVTSFWSRVWFGKILLELGKDFFTTFFWSCKKILLLQKSVTKFPSVLLQRVWWQGAQTFWLRQTDVNGLLSQAKPLQKLEQNS